MLDTNNRNAYRGYDNFITKEMYNTLVNRFNELKNYVTTIVTGKEYDFISSDNSLVLTTTGGNRVTVDFKVTDSYVESLTFDTATHTLKCYNKSGEEIASVNLPNDYITNVDYNETSGVLSFIDTFGNVVDTVDLPNKGTLKDVTYDSTSHEFVYTFSTGQEIRVKSYEDLVFTELELSESVLEGGKQLKGIIINGEKWNVLGEGYLELEEVNNFVSTVNADLQNHKSVSYVKITSLENNINEISVKFEDLSSDLDSFKSKTTTDLSNLNSRVDSIASYVEEQNSNISSIGTSISTLESKFNLLEESVYSDIQSLDNRVSNLEDTIKNLESGVSIDAEDINPPREKPDGDYFILVSDGSLLAPYWKDFTPSTSTVVDEISVDKIIPPVDSPENGGYYILASNGGSTAPYWKEYIPSSTGGTIDSSVLEDYVTKKELSAIEAIIPDMKAYYTSDQTEELINTKLEDYAKQADLDLLNTKVGTIENMINTLNGEVV